MTDDLDKLEQVAKAWKDESEQPADWRTSVDWSQAYAAFGLTFSPDVVLRLIARIRQMEGELQKAKVNINHVLDMAESLARPRTSDNPAFRNAMRNKYKP
jgi:hypothetical protein